MKSIEVEDILNHHAKQEQTTWTKGLWQFESLKAAKNSPFIKLGHKQEENRQKVQPS